MKNIQSNSNINTVLIDKKVEIVVLLKSPNEINPSGADVSLLKGCTAEIIPDVDQSNNIKEILTKEEAAFLEDYLGLPDGALNAHKAEKNFWVNNRNSTIELTRTSDSLESATVILDLSKPYDYIKWKVALASRDVSPTWEKRHDNSDWLYAIREPEDQGEELNKKVVVKETVFDYLLSNKKSKAKLYNLIRLFNSKQMRVLKELKHTQSAKWMYDQLWLLAENKQDLDALYSIITMDEKLRTDKVFLLNGIACGALKIENAVYKLSSGMIIGHNETEARGFFDDANNSTHKLLVKSAIDALFKD